MLTITADGGKLPPYIIFKGKRNWNIEKYLKKDLNEINKKCFIGCNDNAWDSEDIMIDWVNNISKSYMYNTDNFNDD